MAGHAASRVVDKQGIQKDKDDKGVIKITGSMSATTPDQ